MFHRTKENKESKIQTDEHIGEAGESDTMLGLISSSLCWFSLLAHRNVFNHAALGASGPAGHTHTHTHTHTHSHTVVKTTSEARSREAAGLCITSGRYLTAEWTQAKGIPPLHTADNKQAAAVWSASGWKKGELEGDRKLRGKLELDRRQSRKLPANWAKNRSAVEHCSWNIYRSHLFSVHSGGDWITFKQEAVSMNNNNTNHGSVDRAFPSRLIRYSSRGILRQTQQASKCDCLSS